VTPLKLGELWAIPIMLRLALIENLRRVASDVTAGRIDRDLADGWADQMTAIARKDPKSLILVTADMARSNPPMSTAFVSELSRRLQGHGPALALPLSWIEQRLSESHTTIEQLVQSGIQQQAANQVSISNSIGSLRFLGATDWRKFVETMSVVEQKLCEDPHGWYAKMDFVTRDRYRHAVEELAKRSPHSEIEVARRAVQLAHESASGNAIDPRIAHVGYYLIDAGRPHLERAIGAREPLRDSIAQPASRAPLLVYLGAILALTGLLAGGMISQASATGAPPALLGVVVILSVVATSQLAIGVVNALLTLLVTPRLLPRMDFSAGIPPASRALVAVPAMLSSVDAVRDLAEALEVRFLANPDVNLRFALLTDFLDASAQTLDDDEKILGAAREAIESLNAKYRGGRASDPTDTFFLLHRPRLWNARERLWDGLRAKARQARRLECASQRRRGRSGALLVDLRQCRGACRHQIRDHARLRHRAAAGHGAAAGWRDGASAEPSSLRRKEAARHCGIRDSAAARRDEPRGHQSIALRARVRRRGGNRSVHARRLGCLSGRVWRGLVRRQRHLRRRNVRARAQGALSREPYPESRPARGQLCALGTHHRRPAL
jgi:hypothetical protein